VFSKVKFYAAFEHYTRPYNVLKSPKNEQCRTFPITGYAVTEHWLFSSPLRIFGALLAFLYNGDNRKYRSHVSNYTSAPLTFTREPSRTRTLSKMPALLHLRRVINYSGTGVTVPFQLQQSYPTSLLVFFANL
jgi:hypothetical protein